MDADAQPELRAHLAVVQLDLVHHGVDVRAREALGGEAAQRRVDGRLDLRHGLGRDVLEPDGEGRLLLVAAVAGARREARAEARRDQRLVEGGLRAREHQVRRDGERKVVERVALGLVEQQPRDAHAVLLGGVRHHRVGGHADRRAARRREAHLVAHLRRCQRRRGQRLEARERRRLRTGAARPWWSVAAVSQGPPRRGREVAGALRREAARGQRRKGRGASATAARACACRSVSSSGRSPYVKKRALDGW